MRNKKGITLVALVVTIIIMLILAGVSISALTNTGIFEKVQDAKQKSEEAEKEQNKILSEYETALDQYDENTLVYKVNNGEIKIGDYISYTPDTVTKENEKYKTLISNLVTYSGTNENTESTLTQETDMKWRVLDVKDGQVRLISEKPTESTITLYGYNGYNNAVKLLDDTCNTLYNNSKLANKVQNLKIEDITIHMETQPTEDTAEISLESINYPKILEQEENQIVENSIIGNKLKLSEQNKFITGKDMTTISTLKNTYWWKSMSIEDFNKENKEMYYKLFINDNKNNYETYWMSSRCTRIIDKNINFRIRCVSTGIIGADYTSISNDEECKRTCSFRPVITLNSNVQLDTINSGDGSTSENEYAIK